MKFVYFEKLLWKSFGINLYYELKHNDLLSIDLIMRAKDILRSIKTDYLTEML